VTSSTDTPVRERAVLCERGGELAEFKPLLAELGVDVVVHTGELPTSEQLAGVRIVIVAGQRLAEGRPPQLTRWPRTFAIVDDGGRTLTAHLNRIGVAMVLRRPIHPRALRLLLLHELYRGPERRAKKRVPIGHPIRTGSGLFKAHATLLELSRTGARIALANPPKIGSVIPLLFGKELTNARPLKLQAKIVRCIRPPHGDGRGEGEVGVALLDAAEHARAIQAILDRHAQGPATLAAGAAARTAADPQAAAAGTAAPIGAAGRSSNAASAAARPTAPATPAGRPLPPAATDPGPARRLPPSYRPDAVSPSAAPETATAAAMPATAARGLPPVATAVPAAPSPDPRPAPASAAPPALESFGPALDLFDDEDGDLELELEDDLDDAAAPGGSKAVASASGSSGQDRRRSARVPYAQRLVALDEQAARVVVGRDLCAGGMRIAANATLSVGDVLRIALHAGNETEPLVLQAGVERDDGEDGLVLAWNALSAGQRQRLDAILSASGGFEGLRDPDGDDSGVFRALVVGELLERVERGSRASAGFTLIELMIVTAIIGLMTSIALPLFARYQLRSKSTEVKANLSAIRVVEEAHFAEQGRYVAASAEPTLIPGPSAVPFDVVGTDYAEVGWSPEGRVYFSYAVEISADASGYTADAAADIDGNGILQIWGYAKPDPLGALTPGGLGCDPTVLEPESVGPCTVGSPDF